LLHFVVYVLVDTVRMLVQKLIKREIRVRR